MKFENRSTINSLFSVRVATNNQASILNPLLTKQGDKATKTQGVTERE